MKINYEFIPVVPANLPLIELITGEKVLDRNFFGEYALVIEIACTPGEAPTAINTYMTIEEIRQAFGEIASMNSTTLYHETRM